MRHHAQQDRLRPLPPYRLRTAARAINAMRRPESPLLDQLVVIRSLGFYPKVLLPAA